MANEVKIQVISSFDGKGFKDARQALAETKLLARDMGTAVSELNRNMTESDRIGSTFGASLKQSSTRNKVKTADVLDLKPDPALFAKFGATMSEGLGAAGKLAGNHVGITVGAAIGAAAGPTLMSALGAALAAGAGVGVIGTGIALAVKGDPALQKAGKDAGKKFLDGLLVEAKVFKGPILAVLDQLSAAGGRITKELGKSFLALSDDVSPFVGKLISAGEAISDVLTKKAAESGPALAALGDGLKMLGDQVAFAMDMIIDTSPEAAANLKLVFAAIGNVIVGAAMVVKAFEEVGNALQHVTGVVSLATMYYENMETVSESVQGSLSALAAKHESAADAALGQQSALVELSNTMKAETDPVFGLLDAQDKLTKSQKEYSKAVKKGGKDSDEAQAALRKLAQASIELEAKAGGLGDAFNGEVSPALRTTLKTAGMTDRQISDLGRQFRTARRDGEKFAKNYKATASLTIKTYGGAAANALLGTARALKSMGYAHGGIIGAAAGGGPRNGMTLVGEQGPELVSLPTGSTVHSNGDSRRMMAQGDGGNAGGALTLDFAPGAGDRLMDAIVERLRYRVGRNGAGSVQRYLGAAASA